MFWKKNWNSIDLTSNATGQYVGNATIGTLEIDNPGKTQHSLQLYHLTLRLLDREHR